MTPEDNMKLKDEQLQKLWEKSMHDFQPDDVTSFVVESRRSELFYQLIGHKEPTEIKGNYFTSGDDQLIDVIVQDPEKNILFKRTGETKGIINFTSTLSGEYTFIFSNLGDAVYDKTISFALHTYEDIVDPLQYDFTESGERVIVFDPNEKSEELNMASREDLGNVITTLRSMQIKSGHILTEIKLSLQRQNGHNEDVINNGYFYYCMLSIETLFFIGILVYQKHHLKVSLDGRLIL